MFLLVLLLQIEAETTKVDTLKSLPSTLKDLTDWFEDFSGEQGPKLINHNYFIDIANPLQILGGQITEKRILGETREVIFGGVKKPNIMFDGMPVKDPVFGTNDLDLIPVDVVHKISLSGYSFGLGSPTPSINLLSRKNLTDVPFSQLRYVRGSYGAAKLGLDYSRSLHRNLGCYFSVNQLNNFGNQTLGSSRHVSCIGSFYGKVLSPFNGNLLWVNNRRGLPDNYEQSKKTYGGSIIGGDTLLKIGVFFLRRNDEFDSDTIDILNHDLNSIGFMGQSNLDCRLFQIRFGTNGVFNNLHSNYLPQDAWFESGIWTQLDFAIGRFRIRPGVGLNFYDLRDQFVLPQLATKFVIRDSLFLFGDCGRKTVRPGYAMIKMPLESLGSYQIRGNPRLEAEDSYEGSIGLRHQFLSLSFCLTEVRNPIVEIIEQGCNRQINGGAQTCKSFNVHTSLPWPRYVRLYYAGDYTLYDSLRHSYFGISVQRNFTHLSLGMQYEKEFAYDQHIHHVQFMLRFIDFNFFTRVENILDETDHESKARSILVGFFWNFLD